VSRRVAVVTGASSGIGRAITTRLLGDGVHVVGVGRDEPRLRAAGDGAGDRYLPIAADLSTVAGRVTVVETVRQRFETVWALINSAATVVYESPVSLDVSGWRALFEVNVLAPVDLVRGLADRLRGGHVVSISSVTARALPGAKFGPYAATKRALETWSEALRLEAATAGIAVTVIAPGLVDTPLYGRVPGFDNALARLRSDVPVWLSPDDVADAVVWTLTRPARVVVSEIVLLPAGQAR
jgi:NAD(P)-dependent dehydrogenase (short-subunit alcohol dehydrogenase family)